MPKPLVSIVIPVYNASLTIARTLQSIRGQTFSDFEIIAVDDGSTDQTVAQLDGLTDVKLFRQTNQGAGAARNRGVHEASGKYIVFLDADDLWHPQKLALQVKAAASLDHFGMLATSFRRFVDYQSLSKYQKRVYSLNDIPLQITPFEAFFNSWKYIPSCVLIPQKVFLELGGFNQRWLSGEDWDFNLKLASRYPVYCIPLELLYYYTGGQSHLSAVKRLDSIVNVPLILEQWHPTRGCLVPAGRMNYQLYLKIFEKKVVNAGRNILKQNNPELFDLYRHRFSYIFEKKQALVELRFLLTKLRYARKPTRRLPITADLIQNLTPGAPLPVVNKHNYDS